MGVYRDGFVQKSYNSISKKFNIFLKNEKYGSKKALEYLIEERKITEKIIDLYEIGYCPEKISLPDNLNFLRDRIVFPVKDEYGDVAGFTSRIYEKNDDRERWLNDIYDKSYFLYGLDVAFDYIIKYNFIILVEGSVDALLCYKSGLKNTVALLTTKFSDIQMAKIMRLTHNIVVVMDGNESGQMASKEICENINKYRDMKSINVCLKENGIEYDPAEYLSKKSPKFIINQIKKNLNKE